MKKSFITVLILLICTGFAFTAKMGALPEVLKPTMIAIDGNELYVAQGAEISVFSLENKKLLRTFGQNGEGPGETAPGLFQEKQKRKELSFHSFRFSVYN